MIKKKLKSFNYPSLIMVGILIGWGALVGQQGFRDNRTFPPSHKDTIPLEDKVLTFSAKVKTWRIADSVLLKSIYAIGRKMDFEEAEKVKNELEALRALIISQLNKQLADTTKKKE